MDRPRRNSAFTLIELLIVIVVMSIVASAVLPDATPALYDQLHGAARVVAADIAYTRSLAITNNSKYRITFSSNLNTYVIKHSGTDPALNVLPSSPFRSPEDPLDEHIVRLADLPTMGLTVQLVKVQSKGSTTAEVSDLEFGPLGETTRSEETLVWLSAGEGSARRYLSVRVNPVTGLTWVESFQSQAP